MKKTLISIALYFFLFLILFSPNVFAFTDIFGNPELDQLGRVTIWNNCRKTERPLCNWFDPLTWWVCLGGTPQNITEVNRCWNVTYNEINTRVEVFSDSNNINWTNGEMYQAVLQFKPLSVTGVFESYNMTELLYNGFYGMTDEYDSEGNLEREGDSFLIERGKTVLIYLRYRIEETEDMSGTGSWITVYKNEVVVLHYKLNTTEGVTHELRLNVTPDLITDYNLATYINFQFDEPDKDTEVRIYDFALFTFDEDNTFIANTFSDDYVTDQCNVDTGTTVTTIGSNTTYGRRVAIVNSTDGYKGFGCAVFLVDNVTHTRLLNEFSDCCGTAGGGSCSAKWVVSPDIAYHSCSHARADEIWITQIQPHAIKGYIENNNNMGSGSNTIDFSDTGSYLISDIQDYCFNNFSIDEECTFEISASGEQYFIDNKFDSSDTEYHNVFYDVICTAGYSCTFGDLYFLNSDCTQSLVSDCGVWGCNNVGDNCNYPTLPDDPDTPITNFGTFCLDNYTYYTVDETGLEFSSCIYPDICRQTTDTNVQCLTDTEYDNFQRQESTAPTIMAFGLGDLLGVGLDAGLVLLSMIGSVLSASYLGSRFGGKQHSATIFMAVMVFAILGFWYIQWLPIEVALVSVVGISLLFMVQFRKQATGG